MAVAADGGAKRSATDVYGVPVFLQQVGLGAALAVNHADESEPTLKFVDQLIEDFRAAASHFNLCSDDPDMRRGLLTVACILRFQVSWEQSGGPRNDFIPARVLAVLYHDELRAHRQGLFVYDGGCWDEMTAFPEKIMTGMGRAKTLADRTGMIT
eukprot:gene8869-7476_t